jgi:hypothetical protein
MKLTSLELEMYEALQKVLCAYKDYSKIACKNSEEYTSLTAVRRVIKHAKAKAMKRL